MLPTGETRVTPHRRTSEGGAPGGTIVLLPTGAPARAAHLEGLAGLDDHVQHVAKTNATSSRRQAVVER